MVPRVLPAEWLPRPEQGAGNLHMNDSENLVDTLREVSPPVSAVVKLREHLRPALVSVLSLIHI